MIKFSWAALNARRKRREGEKLTWLHSPLQILYPVSSHFSWLFRVWSISSGYALFRGLLFYLFYSGVSGRGIVAAVYLEIRSFSPQLFASLFLLGNTEAKKFKRYISLFFGNSVIILRQSPPLSKLRDPLSVCYYGWGVGAAVTIWWRPSRGHFSHRDHGQAPIFSITTRLLNRHRVFSSRHPKFWGRAGLMPF